MSADTGIDGKTVIITGGTSGLGRSMAAGWAAAGAKVVTTGRRESLGHELEAQARQAGHELTFVLGDVARTGDCVAIVDQAVERYGKIDILVNNAGIEGPISNTHDVTDDEWDAVLDINLGGAFRMARAVIPLFKSQGGGTILNIASINAAVALAHMAAYNASKAAVVQFSNTLAVEYLLDGIRSNAVLLGGVRDGETGLRTQDGIARLMRGPDFVRNTAVDDPLADFVLQNPDEVAHTLAVFCSDAFRLVTGSVLAVDRAMTAGFTSSMMVHLASAELLAVNGG